MKIVINGVEAEAGGGSSGGVTMEQVDEAINTAITGAIQEEYDGTDSSTETSV